jgi:hypothetical protein
MDNLTPTNNVVTITTPKKTNTIPVSDVDFLNVAKAAATKWLQSTTITLIWKTANDFQTLVNEYEISFNNRKQAGSLKPQYVQQLKNLDKEINSSVSHIKNYLVEKYGKNNASSYYAEFGIQKVKNTYNLPFDRNSRVIALAMLETALTSHNFVNMTYGLAFWQPITAQYTSLVNSVQQNSAVISVNVGDKNNAKEEIKEVLNALIYLIKANYPQTYKSELRNWGFQKEKY